MKYLKKFESEKNYLKEYAEHLLSQYIKSNSFVLYNSRIYYRLDSFIKTGVISGLIHKKDKLEDKIQILNDLQYNIKTFMEENKLNKNTLLDYEEYVIFKKSGLTLSEFIDAKKYNL
jgi:hypothetical protein